MATTEISTNATKSDAKAAAVMATFNNCYNWIIAKPAEHVSYAAVLTSQLDGVDKAWAAAAIALGYRAYSGLVRNVGARFIGRYYGVDTTITRVLTLVPYLDNSVPFVQAGTSFKEAPKQILRIAKETTTLVTCHLRKRTKY